MTTSSPSRRRAGIAAAILAVGALATLFVLNGADEADEEVEEVEMVMPEIAAPGDGPDPDPFDQAEGNPSGGRTPSGGEPGGAGGPQMGTGSAIDEYLESSQYPPYSRPLDLVRHHELIEWNERREQGRLSRHDQSIQFIYSGDSYWVIGDQPIRTYLAVRHGNAPIQVNIARAEMRIDGSAESASWNPGPMPLRYTFEGDRYVNEIRPAQLLDGADQAVRVQLGIAFDAGDGLDTAMLNFIYMPQDRAVGRFTGQFREEVRDGSLVLHAGVEIFHSGWFNIDCNLWDSNDEPVGWTRFKGELEGGMQEVELLFFGKVIVDSGTTAPWKVGQLRGFRYVPEVDPSEEMMLPFQGEFLTSSVEIDALSGEEWNEERRWDHLESLREAEQDGLLPSTANGEAATDDTGAAAGVATMEPSAGSSGDTPAEL